MTETTPHRLLIVDDDATTRRLLEAAATANGMVSDLAVNGDDAMQQFAANEYDAVVTDIHMPGAHGHALIVSLLERDNRPMVIAATAVDEPAIIKDLICRGVDEIAFKPMNYELFAVKICALLDRRKRARTKEAAAV